MISAFSASRIHARVERQLVPSPAFQSHINLNIVSRGGSTKYNILKNADFKKFSVFSFQQLHQALHLVLWSLCACCAAVLCCFPNSKAIRSRDPHIFFLCPLYHLTKHI